MLFADMMIDAMNTAFEDGKVAFNCVGMGVAANIFAGTMVDRAVFGKFAADLLRGSAFVCHDMRCGMDLSFRDLTQIVGSDRWNVVRTHLTFAFNQREHGFLAGAACSGMLALAAMLVLFQSADE